MDFFKKSRPQDSFEGVWSESFVVTRLIWEMTLAAHMTDAVATKAALLGFMREKSQEMLQIQEKLFETRKEIFDLLHKNYPERYEQQWHSFVEEISSFQTDLQVALMRLFLLRDVLLQIDETHPKRSKIEKSFEAAFENLQKARELTDKITAEAGRATLDAIIITRSINENISFEAAEEIERKRWE